MVQRPSEDEPANAISREVAVRYTKPERLRVRIQAGINKDNWDKAVLEANHFYVCCVASGPAIDSLPFNRRFRTGHLNGETY